MEEELELDDIGPTTEEEIPQEEIDPTEDMTDDDIAASLGFITTLSQQMLPQDDMTTAEGEEMETPEDAPIEPMAEKEPEEEKDETELEIEAIRKELEALKEEVYGEETEDTDTA